MKKKVFFSFHYQDVIDFRANVVRNHWVVTEKGNDAGFFDESIWEDAKKQSSIALKKLINSGLCNTSVTCVLIGSQTFLRPWVRYEIFRSIYKCNTLLGIHINAIKDKYGKTKTSGMNPFLYTGIYFTEDGSKYAFITRDSVSENWNFWDEIESKRYHENNYFDKEYAKNNNGKCIPLSTFFSTYDWIKDDGYHNFNNWIY